MKEPQLTCPSVDDMQELLCEISNTGVLEDELKDLTNNILKAVKNQYDFYTNDVSDQLEVVRRNNMDLREWGKSLKFRLSQANDKVSELTALSAKGGLLLMENIDKRSQLEEKLESSVSLLRQCQYELRYSGNAGIGKKYSIGTLIFKTLEFLKTIGKDQIG